MTVTEVTTSIAIVGTAALVGLVVLTRRPAAPPDAKRAGRFTVLDVRAVRPDATSFGDGLKRSGRGGARLLALGLVAALTGAALGVGVSLLLVLGRGAAGLGAG